MRNSVPYSCTCNLFEDTSTASYLVTAGDPLAPAAARSSANAAVDESFFAPLAAVGFMKLAVDRRAPVPAALPVTPPLVAAAGLAVESRMLSVAVEVLVGEGAEERETSLFDRLQCQIALF